jgi:hypothetical protein
VRGAGLGPEAGEREELGPSGAGPGGGVDAERGVRASSAGVGRAAGRRRQRRALEVRWGVVGLAWWRTRRPSKVRRGAA